MSGFASIAARLAKIIPRLASDHDGEVVATVKAIDRTLRSAGFDFHDLAYFVNQRHSAYSASPTPPPSQPQPSTNSWKDIAVWCRQHSEPLLEKEKNFIRDMVARSNELTERQANWLRAIYGRLKIRYPDE